jgi:hypothetical protein
MSKKATCKWCDSGNVPWLDGREHWIVKSIILARIDIQECGYYKAGQVSPLLDKKEAS